jgi:hypothetical protein
VCSISWQWVSNALNMKRSLILNKLNRNCITLVSLYWSKTVSFKHNQTLGSVT